LRTVAIALPLTRTPVPFAFACRFSIIARPAVTTMPLVVLFWIDVSVTKRKPPVG
jgi:hypothetical protein